MTSLFCRPALIALLAVFVSAFAFSAETTILPMPGQYDGSDASFERTLSIKQDGSFSLDVNQKGKPGALRSGSAEGKWILSQGHWQWDSGKCHLELQAIKDGMQLTAVTCASTIGDVVINAFYHKTLDEITPGAACSIQGKLGTHLSLPYVCNGSFWAAIRLPAPPATKTQADNHLANQLNCHNVDFGDGKTAKLLGQAAGVAENLVWNKEIKLGTPYTFEGLPIKSLYMSDADFGYLALFVDGDKAAIQTAINQSKVHGNTTIAYARTIGEANGYQFQGKPNGQMYVLCKIAPGVNSSYE